jgi:beta-glucanase (GH16 family)
MRLIFDDEFNGSAPSSTWSTCWWYAPTGCNDGSNDAQLDVAPNVTEAGGYLNLTALDQTVQATNPTTGAPETFSYTSGMVNSESQFSFTYGYVEWRAKMPAGQGLWPSLWMLPENNSWPPELDVLEVLGNDPTTGYNTWHPASPNPAQGFAFHGADLSQGYHTFGADWEPGSITWYVDGKAVASTTSNVTNLAMYLVMELSVGATGSWAGPPNASTHFPAVESIDYVRVWQH